MLYETLIFFEIKSAFHKGMHKNALKEFDNR